MADFGDLSALSRLIEQSYAEMEDREVCEVAELGLGSD